MKKLCLLLYRNPMKVITIKTMLVFTLTAVLFFAACLPVSEGKAPGFPPLAFINVVGKVSDDQGKPLPGVNVSIVGKKGKFFYKYRVLA